MTVSVKIMWNHHALIRVRSHVISHSCYFIFKFLTLLYQRLSVLHEPRGVGPAHSEMFHHREHVDDVLLAECGPVPGLKHILPQLDLKTKERTKPLMGSLLLNR